MANSKLCIKKLMGLQERILFKLFNFKFKGDINYFHAKIFYLNLFIRFDIQKKTFQAENFEINN